MIFWALVVGEDHLLVCVEDDGVGLGSNTLFPKLVRLLPLRDIKMRPVWFIARENILVWIDFSVTLSIWWLLLFILFINIFLSMSARCWSNFPLSRFLAGLCSLTKFLTGFMISMGFPFSGLPMAVEHVWGAIQGRLSWRLEALFSYRGLLFHECGWNTKLVLKWLDVRVFEVVEEFSFLGILECTIGDLVNIELTFNSALVICKNGLFLIFIIIICRELVSFDFASNLLLDNLQGVIVVEAVRCSNKTSLFRNELVKILVLLCSCLSAESRHSCVKCIHSPTHGIDKFWLIFVCETVDLICVFFDFFTGLDHFAVRLTWLKRLGFRSLSIPVFFLVEPAKVNPLFVLECFYFETVGHSLAQWSIIISMLSVFVLCGHLASFVAVFTILWRFYNHNSYNCKKE